MNLKKEFGKIKKQTGIVYDNTLVLSKRVDNFLKELKKSTGKKSQKALSSELLSTLKGGRIWNRTDRVVYHLITARNRLEPLMEGITSAYRGAEGLNPTIVEDRVFEMRDYYNGQETTMETYCENILRMLPSRGFVGRKNGEFGDFLIKSAEKPVDNKEWAKFTAKVEELNTELKGLTAISKRLKENAENILIQIDAGLNKGFKQ